MRFASLPHTAQGSYARESADSCVTCLNCSDPAVVTLRLARGELAPLCGFHLERDSRPCVYFFLAGDVVKIGHAKDWRRRLAQIQSFSPIAVHLWHLVEGGFAKEAELHRRFSEHRSHSEWFFVSDEIRAYVNEASG